MGKAHSSFNKNASRNTGKYNEENWVVYNLITQR